VYRFLADFAVRLLTGAASKAACGMCFGKLIIGDKKEVLWKILFLFDPSVFFYYLLKKNEKTSETLKDQIAQKMTVQIVFLRIRRI
jgi:hypothetical protein